MKKILLIIAVFLSLNHNTFGNEPDLENKVTSIFGANANEKFSLHQPSYFIFGVNDLKLQFSFKYRLARSIPAYFGYRQTMFWNIYDGSKPFKDINFFPEFFYRLIDSQDESFKTLDMGYMHSSNGKKGTESRSADRLFARANYITKYDRHLIDFNLMVFHFYNRDELNKDIVHHMGYWDLKMAFSNLIINDKQTLDLELRLFAGSKGYDLDQGAYQVGLIYNFGSTNINPAIYFQRYEGYAESLLDYNKRHAEYRLGFMLSY